MSSLIFPQKRIIMHIPREKTLGEVTILAVSTVNHLFGGGLLNRGLFVRIDVVDDREKHHG